MEQKNHTIDSKEAGSGSASLPGTDAPLGAVLEAALDAIVTLDSQGKVVHLNPAAEKLFGYSLAEAMGFDITTLLAVPLEHGAGDPEFQHYFTKSKGPVLARRLEMLALHASGA